MEFTEEQMERLVKNFEYIARSLDRIARAQQQLADKG